MKGACNHERLGGRFMLVIVGLLSLSATLQAAEVEVSAEVDRRRVAANEALNLTLAITSARQLVHVSAPQINLAAFDVYGPAISTRMEIVNRRTSFIRDLVYTLYAKRPGRHKIGVATLTIEGKAYQTKSIDIEVSAQKRPGSKQRQNSTAANDELTDNLFLRSQVDRDTVYVNEQVTASFDLCYRYNLRDVGFTQIPTFSGFWSHELFVAQRLDPKVETIGDRQFHVAPLRRMALFATRDGAHEIDVMAVTCAIPQRRQRRSAFDALSLLDDPLFGRTQSVMVRSQLALIFARPLPLSGQPDNFSGLVGSLRINANAGPRQVAMGDPVTLRLKIVGTGNMQSLSAPVIDVAGLKVYDPKGAMQQTTSANGRLGGEATYEYIIIPERGGVFEIPPIEISYFDPERHQYGVAATRPIRLVSEGRVEAARSAPVHDMTRSEIEELGDDIRHIKPDVAELHSPRSLYHQTWFWGLQLALPIGYVALLFARRHQERLRSDVAYARRRGANGAAQRRLQEATAAIGEGEALFFATLQTALVGFVADQVNEPAPGLDRARCQLVLAERGVPEMTIRQFDGLLKICHEGRFAPSEVSAARRQQVLADSETVLDELRDAT